MDHTASNIGDSGVYPQPIESRRNAWGSTIADLGRSTRTQSEHWEKPINIDRFEYICNSSLGNRSRWKYLDKALYIRVFGYATWSSSN
ncbi:hypothetical protein PEX1_039140 [Penicillium expansum]|uniref:Uncharacterized protein n=1 Tax=Penicillium expansum TaxID=27334 RepID=A0A0A2JH30_PENEN|nr:hypothetical protein PEX2_026390 [Penicillium expansum]KGO38294.1 hypothetical protein PEXP_100320 [Penicillium expansum]KGO54101.1 hypothetical protein PEX2_026390 [Penicillium expansum]KGO57312.1 hypothetical protein PEX1_039140 [Penicillium expansum]